MPLRSLAAAALAAIALLSASGCNSGDDPAIDVPVTSSTTAPATSSTAVNGGGTPSSTSTPAGVAKSPEEAARGLFAAWKAKDRTRARAFASEKAIDDLFGSGGTPDSGFEDHGCNPEGGMYSCAWRYEGGALVMTVEDTPDGGFVVESIRFLAD